MSESDDSQNFKASLQEILGGVMKQVSSGGKRGKNGDTKSSGRKEKGGKEAAKETEGQVVGAGKKRKTPSGAADDLSDFDDDFRNYGQARKSTGLTKVDKGGGGSSAFTFERNKATKLDSDDDDELGMSPGAEGFAKSLKSGQRTQSPTTNFGINLNYVCLLHLAVLAPSCTRPGAQTSM